jgi:RNA recognition motif-containing protein
VRSAVPSSTPFAIRNQSVVISAFRRFNSSETPKAFEAPAETVSEIAQERASPFGLEDRPRREERPRFKAEPNQTVYVGNLLFEATPADLEREFAEFGEVVSTRVAQDARGLSKG